MQELITKWRNMPRVRGSSFDEVESACLDVFAECADQLEEEMKKKIEHIFDCGCKVTVVGEEWKLRHAAKARE